MRKVAIVTGASRGIGKAICAHLALKGYAVVVTARTVNPGDITGYPGTIGETAKLVESLGSEAIAVKCDVGIEDDIRATVAQAIDRFGRIDLMVNNARYDGPAMWELYANMDWREIRKAVECNALAPMLFAHLLLPHMTKQGGGVILNVTTGLEGLLENEALPGQGATSLMYPTSKAMLVWFTRTLAKETREANIAVIGFQPGPTLVERATVEPPKGFNLARRHSVHMPSVLAAYLASHPNPMEFNGQIIDPAHEFVVERGLMTSEQIAKPFKDGEVYEPFQEPYWMELTAARG
ncbi:MAG: SDR family NAD(P)-dependent oxidoreductase [Chloroflexi bacterium]|nr:SDR family NAD(P)-dependent oxidoreductase [Chloroflexota bacterium]